MAGSAKFDLSSANPEDSCFTGSYLNGQRGAHPGANLDRLGSFRESINGRGFGTGTSTFKANVGDIPPLTHCLMLEPIPLGDQKFSRSCELRRVLGFSFGGISEESSFGLAHSRPAQSLTIDELKRFRGSIQDGSNKARIRVKRLDESTNKLVTVLSSRKQQIHERSNGSNLLKMGTQSCRASPELTTQRVDDKGKNFLSKRARTPVEGRVSGILRQHMILGKDKDMVKDGSLSPDSVEEQMRKLPTGGESWDKKMKRKRSVSNVFPRPVDGDLEIKRAMLGRLSNDSGLPSPDAHIFRSGSFNGGANTKPESASFAAGSSVRPALKKEMDKASLPREFSGMNKESIFQKGNNRYFVSPSLVTKGKASRVSRAGIPAASNESPNSSHMSGVQEEREQPLNVDKFQSTGGVNNRKRALPGELLSSPMAQWVGQRPQKNSRTRRANVISPTSNDEEALVSSEERVSSDYITKTSGGMNALFPLRATTNITQQLKVENEINFSPARLSETGKIVPAESQSKEKEICGVEAKERGVNGIQHGDSPGLFSKNKLLAKEEVGDGVRRQGRSGRGSSFPRGRMSLSGDKLDSPAAAKPVRSMKLTSDKNGSKSGRPPLKKHPERKGSARPPLVPNDKSPDSTVESEDDREDLLAAAQLACNTSYNACSSPFWKKTEPLFSIRVEDKSYLLQQKDVLTDKMHQPQLIASQGEKHVVSHGLESTETEDLVNQGQDRGLLHRRDLEEGTKNISLLYQRVLSALVIEDELEDLQHSRCEGSPFLSHRVSACSPEEEFFCNGDITQSRCSNIQVSSHDGLCEGGYSFMRSDVGVLPAAFQSCLNGSLTPEMNISIKSSFECRYEQMSMDERLTSELQSIGVYLETVPDLAEGENEMFFNDIVQLEKQLHQLADKKKSSLERTQIAVEKEKELEERTLEQVAVDRLTELAYKKLLATRGNTAARLGISKVPRPVALAFVKRTLARCRKFDETGKSCFSEPPLRDVMLAGQPSCNDFENINPTGVTDHNIQHEAKLRGSYTTGAELLGLDYNKAERKNGPIVNRGKEVLLDDVGNGSAVRSSAPVGYTVVGGAKGKRSERGKDLSARNSFGKSGRPSITTVLGDQKAKSKPKQKAAQLSTHSVGPSASGSSKLAADRRSWKGEEPKIAGSILDSSKKVKDPVDLTNLPSHELDPIELGVDNDIGGNQDLSSWLNFDEDSLLGHDSMGLEIPMDDLSELTMLL